MAGRFVILRFDDRSAAEAFVENRHMPNQLGYKLFAMFLIPTKFCNCPDKQRQNVKNWGKGKLSGLYICRTCKRVSRHHEDGTLSRLQYVFGYNQLPSSVPEER